MQLYLYGPVAVPDTNRWCQTTHSPLSFLKSVLHVVRYELQWFFLITDSALVLHCCKAHAKINRKFENLTHCKILTHEDINLKLGTHDYIPDITHHATFWSNRSSGDFHQIGKYNTFVTYVILSFFS